MMELLSITFVGLFISNILVTNLIGLPLIAEKQVSLKRPLTLGLLTTVMSLITVLIAYPVNEYLLKPENMSYLYPLIAILIIANVYLLLTKISPMIGLNLKLDKDFLPLTSFNAISIFIVMLSIDNLTYINSLAFALGSGLGFLLILIMIAAIKPRLDLPGIPKAFKGLPITLITLGLIGLTFLGLAGIL